MREVMRSAFDRPLWERERAHAMELAEMAGREQALAHIGLLVRRYAIAPEEMAGFFEGAHRGRAGDSPSGSRRGA